MKRKARGTYTRAQVEQHTELSLDLQRTNARASHLLLRLARLRPSNPHFKSLCAELASVAELLTLDISFCEGIANNHVSQPFQRIVLTLHTTCVFCEENPVLNYSKKHDDTFGPLTITPTWAVQLTSLTWLMTRIRQDIFGHSPSPPPETKKFVSCLNGLYTAIQRQRRHLERIGTQERPDIAVRFDSSEVCRRCGRRYEA